MKPTTPPLATRSVQVWLGLIASLLFAWQIWQSAAIYKDTGLVRDVDTASDQNAPQIDINRASKLEFALLPSVGPILAERIVDDRAEHGPFTTIDDLNRVRGIGEKKIAQMSTYCIIDR